MSEDIRPILAGWNFEPDLVQVRIITGDDGTRKIQMRMDLGLLQMEIDGRPDGERPQGYESLLELYEARASKAAASGDRFSLKADDCSVLMREGLQYYHRYVSAFQLERFDLVERDTSRNLRLFSFVAKYAARQRDRMEFEQYRPYVQLMHTRAGRAWPCARRIIPRRSATSTRESRPSAISWPSTRRKSVRPSARSCDSSGNGVGRLTADGRSAPSNGWSSSSRSR